MKRVVGAMVAAAGIVAAGVRAEPPQEGLVSVAMLSYADGKTSRCFANGFLRQVAYRTEINVDQEFAQVALGSGELFEHPFAVMTGEGVFELSEAEVEGLRDFLRRGGLLLASAGCSNPDWSVSFERAMERVFPERELEELSADHDVYHTLFELRELRTKKQREARILGMELDGRLAVIFSPQGLNDTEEAGHGCCCCGGDEVRDAKLVNANALVYALLK